MVSTLSIWDSACFNAVLNCLIPPNSDKNIPGAGMISLAGFMEAQVNADVTLNTLFKTGFECLRGITDNKGNAFEALPETERIAALRELEQEAPEFFAELVRLTYMGYYSRADIRVSLGLSGDPVHPKGYDVEAESSEFLTNLTAPVRARGNVFRDV